MDWRDEGIVLRARPHGETSAVADILCRRHGRCRGLLRGARSRRMRAVIQPGNSVWVTWRARLENHLGHFTLETSAFRAAGIIDRLPALRCLTVLTYWGCLLPEREPQPGLHDALSHVLNALEDDAVWPSLLVHWELGFLRELGFGLDLRRCAVTGSSGKLTHVSPRTGRAVSAEIARPYETRLLPLPAFLTDADAESDSSAIAAGLRLTGYFLKRHILTPHGRDMPQQRERLVEYFQGFWQTPQ